MKLNDRVKHYLNNGFVSFAAVFRYLYSGGQTIVPYTKFGEYIFKRSGHPVTAIAAAMGVLGNVGTNSLVKIPAMYRKQNTAIVETGDVEVVALTCSGKFICGIFKVAGSGLMVLEFISGNFGTVAFFDAMAGVVGFSFQDNLAGKISLQALGAMGGGSAAMIFRSYEFHYVANQNAKRIAKLYEDGKFYEKIQQNPSPFYMTSFVMFVSVCNYMMLAAFWMKSAADDFSENTMHIEESAKLFACFSVALFSFVFTLGWSPTMYEKFARPEEAPASVDKRYRDNCTSHGLNAVAMYSLPVEIVTWGVTIYMAYISNAEFALDADPYGPMIGLAGLCGLVAALFYGSTLKLGLKETLDGVKSAPHGSEKLLTTGESGDEENHSLGESDGEEKHSLLQKERDAVSVKALTQGRRSSSAANDNADESPKESIAERRSLNLV